MAGFGLGLFLIVSILTPRLLARLAPCANSKSCISDLSGIFQSGKTSTFLGRSVAEPTYLATNDSTQAVLGENTGSKHIYIDLAAQKIYAYQGDNLVYTFPTSTGKWGKTPTGEFRIWIKLRYTRMEGGSGADYYNLYNVPYVMFFQNDSVPASRGFSIHGAYWHNNFGHIMSHGCINLRPVDAGILYNWANPSTNGNTTHATADNPGTPVTIYGQPTEE